MKPHSVLTVTVSYSGRRRRGKAAVARHRGIRGSSLLLPAATAFTTPAAPGHPGSSAYPLSLPYCDGVGGNATVNFVQRTSRSLGGGEIGVKLVRTRVPRIRHGDEDNLM